MQNPTQSAASSGMNEVFELTWDVFGELCRALALRVYHEYDPNVVVGIATAGVIPAAVIADMLQVDFYSMKITRRRRGERVMDQPELVTAAPPQIRGKRVLLVDELATTGATMRIALAAVNDVGPEEVRTAASFCRPGGFRPDFYAMQTDALIVFPWDRKIVDQGEFVVHPTYDGLL